METAEEPVHPLRLSKNTPASSPTKPASSIPRPLSELSPTSQRRNSPSWNQGTKKMALNNDSSPFQSSPLDGTTSPRLFWQNRGLNSDHGLYGGGRGGSPSPTRRSSIERLQRASRVKNSNILALEHKNEYDPTKIPQIERPLAKVQGNAYGSTGISGLRSSQSPTKPFGHRRSESATSIPLYSPTKFSLPEPPTPTGPRTPGRDQSSPIKSSLSSSRFKSSYDPETGAWSGDASGDDDDDDLPYGKSLHRHAKSVTFDAAPPQINEYEMATPDLSSIGTNSREGSFESEEDEDYDGHYHVEGIEMGEDSFDASLEDTDKTPVVGPDDGDPFEGSPMPDAVPSQASTGRPQHNRTDSANSTGSNRPLPPLPGMAPSSPLAMPEHTRTHSNSSSATAERMLGSHRSLPSPPAAAATKSEIQNIGNGTMSLEQRLKLMMLSDDHKSAAELQRERRMRRAGARDRVGSATPEREGQEASIHDEEEGEGEGEGEGEEDEEDAIGDISGLDEYQLPPRISRESIMRRVNGNRAAERQSDYNFSSPAPSSSPERRLPLDPDVPIPSTEDSMMDDIQEEGESSVLIHRDVYDEDDDGTDDEDKIDVYDIPDLYQRTDSDEDDQSDATEQPNNGEDDAESHYSEGSLQSVIKTEPVEEDQTEPVVEGDKLAGDEPADATTDSNARGLPEMSHEPEEIEFSQGLHSFMLPKPKEADVQDDAVAPKMADAQAYLQRPYTPLQTLSKPEYDGSGWGEPEEEEEEGPTTPESVIHTPLPDDEYMDEESMTMDSPMIESPAIPERTATIKAPGSKLKTRLSGTPADLTAMREQRRQVSREVPNVPPIPDRHRNRMSRDFQAEPLSASDDFLERHPSFKKRSLTLDLDLGLSLDQDFERVIEAQKRGYLMRQNTKLVAASDKDADFRGCRSAGSSPIKGDRPQSWTVEPWNPQTRRKSVRKRTTVSTGPAPPLPGQESNAAALSTLAEDEAGAELATEDSGERGRLFVKVMGVKDLDLPIPRNERTWFSLTLDNGVHCVTTAWLEMARNAPIGQEFELVVPNDLEFQLTLNVKLEKPLPQQIPQSPSKASKPKTSTFSRVFASPKKRKEMELRQREEEERLVQQQREAHARQRSAQPTAWDLLSPLAAEDGSFARSYVCLKEHEARCFGRPYLVDVAAFNEWATEEAAFASSVKSKRGNNTSQVVRRAPYKIGKLELQLLFVPRPKGSSEDDMPKSMNSCIREMKAAEERLARNWEGTLSQQGGDCPFWRRRYFKLVGTKLTAYHESTRQPRATINLANAKRLIDDRRQLTERETTGKNGKRRRSAFAEEEEGYMFVEEGFRIRFNNGEVIDFYADTAQDKEGWMKVLSSVVGGDNAEDDSVGVRSRAKWCELVLKREDAVRRRTEGRRVHSRTKSSFA